MTNAAYLIANDRPGGAAGEVGWDPKTDLRVADAPLAVPVYWLAIFDEADLVRIDVGDDRGVPSLATGLEAARERFRIRRPLLAARFPEFDPDWERFDARLATIEARFLKVDLVELWEMGKGDESEAETIQSAVRWFESRDEDEFEQLLVAACIAGYDLARRAFPPLDDSTPRTFQLYGRLNGETDA